VDESANDDFGDLRLTAGSPASTPATTPPCRPTPSTSTATAIRTSHYVRSRRSAALCRRHDRADTGAGTPPLVDLGAYELAKIGDVKCDGVVNLADIQPLRTVLVELLRLAGHVPRLPAHQRRHQRRRGIRLLLVWRHQPVRGAAERRPPVGRARSASAAGNRRLLWRSPVGSTATSHCRCPRFVSAGRRAAARA